MLLHFSVDTGRNNYLWTGSNAVSLAHYGPLLPSTDRCYWAHYLRFLIRMSCKWQDFLCTPMSLEKHHHVIQEWAGWVNLAHTLLIWQACTGRWGSRRSWYGMKGHQTHAGYLREKSPVRGRKLSRLHAGTAYCRQVQLSILHISLTMSRWGAKCLYNVAANIFLNILSKIAKAKPLFAATPHQGWSWTA